MRDIILNIAPFERCLLCEFCSILFLIDIVDFTHAPQGYVTGTETNAKCTIGREAAVKIVAKYIKPVL